MFFTNCIIRKTCVKGLLECPLFKKRLHLLMAVLNNFSLKKNASFLVTYFIDIWKWNLNFIK